LLFAAKMKRSKVTPRSIVKQQNRCQAIILQMFSMTLTQTEAAWYPPT